MKRTRVCFGHNPQLVETRGYDTQSAALRAVANVVRGCEMRKLWVHAVETWYSEIDAEWVGSIIHDVDAR